ncbi:MAG TPA: hypothetical protein P5133_10890 [Spirochaetia bacterium]|nr:hypothetical protein [Spirochaetia bacterium]HRZ65425.1 hypothetical protein [Spirochaetia bacterium]
MRHAAYLAATAAPGAEAARKTALRLFAERNKALDSGESLANWGFKLPDWAVILVIAALALIALAALVLPILAGTRGTKRRKKHEAEAPAAPAAEIEKGSAVRRDEAARLAESGEAALAILALHRASVALAEERGLGRPCGCKCNGEIALVLTSEARSAFSSLAAKTERLCFGGDRATDDDWSRAVEDYEAMKEALS